MDIRIIGSLEEVEPAHWDRLAGEHCPFTRHAFLVALERHGCVGQHFGWLPQHLLAYEGGQLLGAVPMYIKDNSYGEFVFDWAWADAYARAGLHYYPKLVAAIPYTPATGPRLLIKGTGAPRAAIAQALIAAALRHAQSLGLSSLHWLFTDAQDTARLAEAGLMLREGCQFHWQNRHPEGRPYRDFDDFLATFSAAKRKKVRRERRRVREQGVTLEVLHGSEIAEAQWRIYHDLYADTFIRKGGTATLSLNFFRELGHSMPDSVVLVLARYAQKYVAAAFNLRGSDTLYGRHWGCSADFHSLHFEACYYQGLEYCIRHGLQRFEPGAQGEHKVSRGFLPTPVWSAHWIAHPAFRDAIGDFLERERRSMAYYRRDLSAHTPYKTCRE